ncbi:unnamed protein product [Cylindrotheca closterium]|uniref:Pyridoxamine 5'-phosphate oxidase N-terminal domain-containing protein n=1 Tax=Cylindrotheca closterium TaxID=2856 RepID=A0AAD2G9G4_9STRA|nr:unnamed protein product [Cylindrotheca closterium]
MNNLLDDTDQIITVATSVAFVAAPLLYYRITNYFWNRHNKPHPLATILKAQGNQIKPPFPQTVRDLLSKCNLAYLSTIDQDLSSSHLSLMRFTYLNDPDDGEVVIMSTNTQTKKFGMLQKQKGVALLIHDFGSGGNYECGAYSITLNGECRIVDAPQKAEEYRQAHLKHNPEYPQFIVGEHIAILCIDVKSARICNINDQVIKWDVSDNHIGTASGNRTATAEVSTNGSSKGAPTVLRV